MRGKYYGFARILGAGECGFRQGFASFASKSGWRGMAVPENCLLAMKLRLTHSPRVRNLIRKTGDMTVFTNDFAAVAFEGADFGVAVAARAVATVSSQSSQQSSSQSEDAPGWAESELRSATF